MTLQERFALGLTQLGEKEVQSKSRKYRTFTRLTDGFYFLGSSGAVRYGRHSSHSVPVSDTTKARILTAGDNAWAIERAKSRNPTADELFS